MNAIICRDSGGQLVAKESMFANSNDDVSLPHKNFKRLNVFSPMKCNRALIVACYWHIQASYTSSLSMVESAFLCLHQTLTTV